MFQNIYPKNENLQPSWTNTQLFICMQNVHMYKCTQTQTQIYVMVMGRHVFLLSKTPEMQETTWLHIFFSKATHAVFWLCSANIHVQEKKKKKKSFCCFCYITLYLYLFRYEYFSPVFYFCHLPEAHLSVLLLHTCCCSVSISLTFVIVLLFLPSRVLLFYIGCWANLRNNVVFRDFHI